MPYDSNGIWSLTAGYLGVTGQTILPSNHNPPLEDIRDNGLSAVLVRDGRAPMTGALNMGTTNKITNLANGTSPNDAVNFSQLSAATADTRGSLYGLTLSNNVTDATNDIDIAAGSASADNVSPYPVMTLAATLTKRLDAAWAVGSGQGGLDTGAIANVTYHIYLIQRSDTGVVDACFSTSATAPTTGGSIPAAYDRWRRIGSIIRAAAAIRLFDQNDDTFLYRVVPTADRNSTAAQVAALLAVSVPAGIIVKPILKLTLNIGGASSNVANALGTATAGGTPSFVQQAVAATAYLDMMVVPPVYSTNTSSQLYFGCQIISGTITGNTVETLGWVDTRGRV